MREFTRQRHVPILLMVAGVLALTARTPATRRISGVDLCWNTRHPE